MPRRHVDARRLTSALLLLCLGAVGCISQPEIPTGLGDPAPAGHGACGLLTVAEIEVALNTPLSGAQSTADRQPSPAVDAASPQPSPADDAATGAVRPTMPGMRMCAIGNAAAGATWGLLTDGAEDAFARYTQWHEPYLEPAEVDGHRAVWDPGLDTIVALGGDAVIAVTLFGSDLPADEDGGEAIDLSRWARELAARALRRVGAA